MSEKNILEKGQILFWRAKQIWTNVYKARCSWVIIFLARAQERSEIPIRNIPQILYIKILIFSGSRVSRLEDNDIWALSLGVSCAELSPPQGFFFNFWHKRRGTGSKHFFHCSLSTVSCLELFLNNGVFSYSNPHLKLYFICLCCSFS